MDVNVGAFSDPDGLEGLAHFLEHMLFYASEKYPSEDSYSKYISEHGGRTNAYTASENTNYYFDINSDGFEEALDRFAQFFINPLMSADTTMRELKDVDSENQNNLLSAGESDLTLEFSFFKVDIDLTDAGHAVGCLQNGFSMSLDIIQMVLNKLSSDNVRIFWESKKFEGHTNMSEPWYGTPYSVERITGSMIQEWILSSPNENLHLPARNVFIPTDLSLKNDLEKDPAHIDLRVEEFLKGFETKLYEMPNDEFKSNVNALIDMKIEKHRNLREEAGFYWGEISVGTLKFDRKESERQNRRYFKLQKLTISLRFIQGKRREIVENWELHIWICKWNFFTSTWTKLKNTKGLQTADSAERTPKKFIDKASLLDKMMFLTGH
ncbi:hypothetical protein C1H46_024584 [Malus baccata]|uniref:Peptidase M16 N-terminal domain-containing protein n=1 Tax=Malus baccata TaxID=106549 RepID=A0A540LUB9_MALBA|nr:hypothetical protein C1H46_024584 [Malus baccata]